MLPAGRVVCGPNKVCGGGPGVKSLAGDEAPRDCLTGWIYVGEAAGFGGAVAGGGSGHFSSIRNRSRRNAWRRNASNGFINSRMIDASAPISTAGATLPSARNRCERAWSPAARAAEDGGQHLGGGLIDRVGQHRAADRIVGRQRLRRVRQADLGVRVPDGQLLELPRAPDRLGRHRLAGRRVGHPDDRLQRPGLLGDLHGIRPIGGGRFGHADRRADHHGLQVGDVALGRHDLTADIE